jgi:hypothetical protein
VALTGTTLPVGIVVICSVMQSVFGLCGMNRR